MPPDDPVVAPAAPPAPAPDPVVSPPESPAPASIAEPQADAPSAQAPEVEPAAGENAPGEGPPEIPAAETKPHTEVPTLMERAGQESTEPPVQPPIAPTAAEPRTYEPFTFPEGMTVEDARIAEAAALFAADNLPQERAQAYLDHHIAELQRFEAGALQAQHEAFANTRAEWVKQVMADPEIGGSGFQTAMKAIAQMRDLFVSSASQTSERYGQEMQEFNDFLRITGAGDHPAFNRFLHNVARRFMEPAAPSITLQPPPDIGRRPNGTGTRSQVLYGTVQSGTNGQNR